MVEHQLVSLDNNMETLPLQSDINKLFAWSTTWNLQFNESKFVHMRFWQNNSESTPFYYVNNNNINQKTQHEDLGIISTSNLNWTPQYNSIISQAYKVLGLI